MIAAVLLAFAAVATAANVAPGLDTMVVPRTSVRGTGLDAGSTGGSQQRRSPGCWRGRCPGDLLSHADQPCQEAECGVHSAASRVARLRGSPWMRRRDCLVRQWSPFKRSKGLFRSAASERQARGELPHSRSVLLDACQLDLLIAADHVGQSGQLDAAPVVFLA